MTVIYLMIVGFIYLILKDLFKLKKTQKNDEKR